MAGMPIEWRESGLNEVGVDGEGNTRVRIDPRYFRPAEVDLLQGDASYAREKLGWEPKVTFNGLVRMMVDADCAAMRDKFSAAHAVALLPR
jgi:GDPmannose 4,6-dehydratase